MLNIYEASLPADIQVIRRLFAEYAQSLSVDLDFQGFDDELAGLPGAYQRPKGLLLLAKTDGLALGCVAVRPLEWPRYAELKRLYVRPDARGMSLGRRLSEQAMEFATLAGYQTLRLDTLPEMTGAQALYERLGFDEIPCYRFNPVPGTRYMERELSGGLRNATTTQPVRN